ncbi:PREDICTED: uncharacterized protein LOC104827123 [Tarenaya hassleriana]|uniref:uncharacterized protein LOC104827123 n=1 Tax=Tarenaya hassleriana TaxID=28532 RepID=UPI00053C3090|nr:PREDICTED: uncharacterized protein LOC104827123 [Tarenaya hassleriana]
MRFRLASSLSACFPALLLSVCFSRKFRNLLLVNGEIGSSPITQSSVDRICMMFLHNFVRRRLSSLLRPLMREEPDLRLELGFTGMTVTLRNLKFDVSLLNQLLDGSARLYFEEFTVDYVGIHLSVWSAPAFKIEFRGVHVKLSARAMEEGSSRRTRTSHDTVAKEIKEVLSSIDPEGCFLHEILEKIMGTTSQKSKFKISCSNLMLRHCSIRMVGISVQVWLPTSSDSLGYVLNINELRSESEDSGHGSLLRGSLSALLFPLSQSSVNLSGCGFKIGYKRNSDINNLCFCSDLAILINLHNLQPVDLIIRVPELGLLCQPTDLPALLALSMLSSNKSKSIRSGRHLWKVAAIRIGSMTSSHKLSFWHLVGTVILWLHYVNAYEYLLLSVGFSRNKPEKSSFWKISGNKGLSATASRKWEAICNIEKELPTEAIAQARRVARYRAWMNVQEAEGNCEESSLCRHLFYLYKVIWVLAYIWRVIYGTFLSMTGFLFSRRISSQELGSNIEDEVDSEHLFPEFHAVADLGRVSITFYPEKTNSPFEKSEKNNRLLYSNFVSLCLSVDEFLLRYIVGFSDQSLSISCGKMKVVSSNFGRSRSVISLSKDPSSSVERNKKHMDGDLKPILCVGPAEATLLSNLDKSQRGDRSEGAMHLQDFLREMWSSWIRGRLRLEEIGLKYSEKPCVLCEIKSCTACRDLGNQVSGRWKCGIILGKMDVILEYSSLLSMVLLFLQSRCAQRLFTDEMTAGFLSNSRRTSGADPENSSSNKYESCSRKIGTALHRHIPEKQIHVGVLVAGPQIQLSVEKGINNGEVGDVIGRKGQLVLFDFHDVEFAVWPSSKSDVVSSETSSTDNAKSDWPLFKKLRLIDTGNSTNGKYVSQGWNSLSSYLGFDGFDCSFCKMTEKQWSQTFVLRPITICFSSVREHVYSFTEAVTAFSTGVHALALGLTIVSRRDDLNALFQMLLDLFSELSRGLSDFGSVVYSPGKELLESDVVHVEKEIDGMFHETLFSVNASVKLKPVNVILHIPAANNRIEKFMELTEFGIWSSVRETSVDVSYEESRLHVNVDLCDLKSIVFRYQDDAWKSFSKSINGFFPFKSHHLLSEACLSSFVLRLYMDCSGASAPGDSCFMAGDSSACYAGSSSKASEMQNLYPASDPSVPYSSYWMDIDLALTDLLIARCSIKNVLVGARRSSKFLTSVSVGRKFRSISWAIQGGLFILEPVALMIFIQGFSSYLDFISSKVSTVQSSAPVLRKAEADSGVSELNVLSQQIKMTAIEGFSVDVTQFVLGFVGEDEYGGIRELVLEVNLHIALEMESREKKFLCEISRLSVLSKILENIDKEIHIAQFSSPAFSETSSFLSGAPHQPFQQRDVISLDDSTSVSGDLDSTRESPMYSDVPGEFYSGYILKDLRISVFLKKPENDLHQFNDAWVGSCSVVGFDITISLSELQMILSMISSFAGLTGGETTDVSSRRQSSDSETKRSLESVVPDGAIVAIQDVHQHLFFTVEGGQDKYMLAGTLHYSLVGERALFRVKYHRQRRWKSSILWFSLTSLYAKNVKGEPLQLTYHSGSDAVNISGIHENATTLWRASFCEFENYKGDIDWETYRKLVEGSFFLVNKKSNSAVAFIDGFPEFVRKPGNPFKFKVFRDSLVTHDVRSTVHHEDHNDEMQASVKDIRSPCISITFDEVALTIVHELSETRDRFPLLRGSINITQLVVQMLCSKARIISTSKVSIEYYDAQKYQWQEFILPVEVNAFCRSTYQTHDLINASCKAPIHIYCRTGRLEAFLTELSLDILLFVLGKLEFAGPFSVKSAAILSNCCKIENHSGLDLLCRFNGRQTVAVSRTQTASILLRYSDLVSNSPEASPVAAIQLSAGNFTTSSINLSLLLARTLAWRTRIVSVQDSRSHPGPFIVVDIKKGSEDGLSISVSPLTRIHNETRLPMEIRFRRPEQKEDDYASVTLKPGGAIDDSVAAINAISLSGNVKKALTSLAVGNFSLSFRPESLEILFKNEKSLMSDWSEELKGGKAVHLSGIFDKLSYGVKKTFSIESVKCSFTTAYCSVTSEHLKVGKVHFLIQSIGRDVPIMQPDVSSDGSETHSSSIALREQKEIFLLPTVQVSNFLSSEVAILLTETDDFTSMDCNNSGKPTTVQSGETVDFYVNPIIIYFSVTLTAFGTCCKSVNSSQWVKKLQKQKSDVECLDVDLDFSGGKYYASLRLTRGKRGILEAAVFTSYTLRNDSDCSLFFYSPGQKPLSRDDIMKFDHSVPPEFGLYLPPEVEGSWFLRSCKVCVKLVEDRGASEAILNLDTLSGLTEVSLETEDEAGFRYITRFGLSVRPISSKICVPTQIVTIAPRHLVINDSEETIIIQQCCFQDDSTGIITLKSKQRSMLRLREEIAKRKELHLFENFIRKHGNDKANSLIFIQFRPHKAQWTWSGPLCITSMGRFFLKFRKQHSEAVDGGTPEIEFASVNVTEDGSTLTVHFHKPPNIPPPYRIENFLHSASVTYYQKDSSEIEVLGPGSRADYAWDDMTLPHKLVVIVNDLDPLREVNLDKIRPWRPLLKVTQHRGLVNHLVLEKKANKQKINCGELSNIHMVKVGYEVYADGLTRVLRICEVSESSKGDTMFHSRSKIQFRVNHLGIHLLEKVKQNFEENSVPSFAPILVVRLENICLQSLFTDQQKFNQICIEALTVDHKWAGAPFAAMLRQHHPSSRDSNYCLFRFVFVLVSSGSNVTQVKYSSIVLQPIDLNLDEETLMRIVPFWRTSLSTNSQSRQFYFDHFEIHPIKIITNFLPGDSYSSYNSAQETLRSLLHSVIKVPRIKNMVVELNGVLITHALITVRELLIRCVKHYSWYSMRAIYIAKGSLLLPPAFASMFDDFASSSLDAFFDPSGGLVNIPGLTLGTFKLLSRFIDSKGLSGTRRYFGDLGKTLKTAGSNVVFAAVTEISDSVLKGAEMKGLDGLVSGFHQGILKLAMEPSLIGTALMEGGPDRTIKLDRSPGVDELYIEGYLQAVLDTIYRQEYLRVKVIDDQVFLKNLPPSSSLIDEIMDRVKDFLESRGLLKVDPTTSRPLRRLHGEREWKIGPTVMALCEHLFVSFTIRMLRQQASKFVSGVRSKEKTEAEAKESTSTTAIVPAGAARDSHKVRFMWSSGIGKFIASGIIAYIDGRLCRNIPNPLARRIVSGFLLSLLDNSDEQ